MVKFSYPAAWECNLYLFNTVLKHAESHLPCKYIICLGLEMQLPKKKVHPPPFYWSRTQKSQPCRINPHYDTMAVICNTTYRSPVSTVKRAILIYSLDILLGTPSQSLVGNVLNLRKSLNLQGTHSTRCWNDPTKIFVYIDTNSITVLLQIFWSIFPSTTSQRCATGLRFGIVDSLSCSRNQLHDMFSLSRHQKMGSLWS